VILDHAVTRNVDEVLRHKLQNVRHHAKLDVEFAERFAGVLGLE